MAATAIADVAPRVGVCTTLPFSSSTGRLSLLLPFRPKSHCQGCLGFSTSSLSIQTPTRNFKVVCCHPPPSPSPSSSRTRTKLFVSGLSFRTTEGSLRNAFNNFGELVEVNLVMGKVAKRSRGFAFLRYATEEESNKAIEGMHGKFLDGRVIFVEVAKPRSKLRRERPQRR